MDNPNKKKYLRRIFDASGNGQSVEVDVYRVLDAFAVVSPALQHAIKKMLCPGKRGVKSTEKDLSEAMGSISEALLMLKDTAAREATDILSLATTDCLIVKTPPTGMNTGWWRHQNGDLWCLDGASNLDEIPMVLKMIGKPRTKAKFARPFVAEKMKPVTVAFGHPGIVVGAIWRSMIPIDRTNMTTITINDVTPHESMEHQQAEIAATTPGGITLTLSFDELMSNWHWESTRSSVKIDTESFLKP